MLNTGQEPVTEKVDLRGLLLCSWSLGPSASLLPLTWHPAVFSSALEDSWESPEDLGYVPVPPQSLAQAGSGMFPG